MRLVAKTLMAGPDGVVQPGTEFDCDPERAKALLDGGFAGPPVVRKAKPTPAPPDEGDEPDRGGEPDGDDDGEIETAAVETEEETAALPRRGQARQPRRGQARQPRRKN